MSSETKFRILILILIATNAVWSFWPWGNSYGALEQEAMVFSGMYAGLSETSRFCLYAIYMALWHAGCLGLLLFSRAARFVFCISVAIGVLSVALGGIAVQTSSQALLGYLVSVCEGVVLGLSFFTGVSSKFSRKN